MEPKVNRREFLKYMRDAAAYFSLASALGCAKNINTIDHSKDSKNLDEILVNIAQNVPVKYRSKWSGGTVLPDADTKIILLPDHHTFSVNEPQQYISFVNTIGKHTDGWFLEGAKYGIKDVFKGAQDAGFNQNIPIEETINIIQKNNKIFYHIATTQKNVMGLEDETLYKYNLCTQSIIDAITQLGYSIETEKDAQLASEIIHIDSVLKEKEIRSIDAYGKLIREGHLLEFSDDVIEEPLERIKYIENLKDYYLTIVDKRSIAGAEFLGEQKPGVYAVLFGNLHMDLIEEELTNKGIGVLRLKYNDIEDYQKITEGTKDLLNR